MSERNAHIFLVHGDIRRIACDGWLLPCGRAWDHDAANWYPEYMHFWTAGPAETYAAGTVARVANWPPPTVDADLPQPWLVDIVGGVEKPVDFFVDRALRFIETTANYLREHPKTIQLRKRERPLLALPLIGTGGGGAYDRTGEIAAALLPAIQQKATECGVDVALILKHAAKYAAAVKVREQTLSSDPRTWPVPLTEDEYTALARLAYHARQGSLVLFIGAGVSIGAGLPSWDGLLTQLALDEQILPPNDADYSDRFHQLNPLDRARVIEVELQRRGENIADALGRILRAHPHPSLAHYLLAMLPCDQAVSTNYDRLFEIACEGNGRPVAAIPRESLADRTRWVLKLHGSIEHPEDLVFTREDYLRYDERRAALKGIVQAMLITRKMLFVGFSMNDDNFHRIIDDVRKARLTTDPDADGQSTRFGASLGLRHDPIFERLWGSDLEQVSVEDPEVPGVDSPAARRLEIFLDALAQLSAAATAHILDPRFNAILSDSDRALRDHLLALVERVPGARGSDAWPKVVELIRSLGGSVPEEPC